MWGIFSDTKVYPTALEPGDTMEDAWKIVIWSLLACFLGEHPTEAWASDADVELSRGGMYLAGGFFLVIWSLKADLEAWYKGLFLRHHNSNEFCEFCPAHSSMADDDEPMRWNNFKAGALWKKQAWTAEQWREKCTTLHWLFIVFRFLSQHNLEVDELHTIYLGILQYMLGSVLWVMCYKSIIGEPSEILQRVWTLVAEYYSDNSVNTRFTSLTLSMFTDPDSPYSNFPRLRGRGIELRDITPALLHAWRRLRCATTYEFHNIEAMLVHETNLPDIISRNSQSCLLPEEDARQFAVEVVQVLRFYTILANKADSNHNLLWSMVPKCHYLLHMGAKALFLSPRMGGCLIDEDYVGKIKLIVSKGVNGTSPVEVL